MSLRLLIRADAAVKIGTGHVMRCLALAGEARAAGGDARFLCREHEGALVDFVRGRGFECATLPLEDDSTWLGGDEARDAARTAECAADFGADRVVVDHYEASAAWERAQSLPLLAIDDLLGRAHDCRALLNQNLGATEDDYAGALAAGTRTLLGPRFALLRPEFAALRERALGRREAPVAEPRLLVTMGGADEPNAAGWVLDALAAAHLPAGSRVTVVSGKSSPHLESLRTRAASLGPWVEVLPGTDRMGELMVQSDLAIGAGGSTSWERCVLGLPSIVVVIADNQVPIAAALDAAGAARQAKLGDTAALAGALQGLLEPGGERLPMARAAAGVCDGLGARRVLDALGDLA